MSGSFVWVEGVIVDTPHLDFTPGGKPVFNFILALPRMWIDDRGVRQERFTYVNCSAFGDLAENSVDSLFVGAHVSVTGRLKADGREPITDNHESKLVVIADEIGAGLRRTTVYIENTNRSIHETKPKEDYL